MLELDSWDCHLNDVTLKKKDLLEKKQRLGNDITNNKEFPWEIQWTASVHFGRTNYIKWFGTTLIKPTFDLPLKADMWRYFSSYVFFEINIFFPITFGLKPGFSNDFLFACSASLGYLLSNYVLPLLQQCWVRTEAQHLGVLIKSAV